MIAFGKTNRLDLRQFRSIVFDRKKITLCPEALKRLEETRRFIDYLLTNRIRVYGLTTGFADLRNKAIDPSQAAQLSCNLIHSHDAGIGPSLSWEATLGAMVIRASSLAKGHSGFQPQSLETLIQMINHSIVPAIPKTGSLGASGDLAFLARVSRAMCGEEVPVWFEGTIMTAKEALNKEKIVPFNPLAKEGLAMTNGTSFMSSMLAIAYLQEIHELENILAMQGLFLNAVRAVEAAFNEGIHQVRQQTGQQFVSRILSKHLHASPFIDTEEVQDDYCIRCLPQIFGPKIEAILEQEMKIEKELDAVTDNPLFFKEEEISDDTTRQRILRFNEERWVVLSGGNFHGECVTTIADIICAANAKIALTLERQMTYMLNPFRNKHQLPCYLIADDLQTGLLSGYMITQYTANALAQKIAQLGIPSSIFNLTSANESEDIVSYGATAAERLLEQIERLKELNIVFFTTSIQAYSLTRKRYLQQEGTISSDLLAEQIFRKFQEFTGESYPVMKEESFDKRYQQAAQFLSTQTLRSLMDYPLKSHASEDLNFLEVAVKNCNKLNVYS